MAKKAELAWHAVEAHGEAANEHEHEAAWQLIRDDRFDDVTTDEQLEAAVQEIAERTPEPHAEILRRLLGMDGLTEDAARSLFRQILAHRAAMSTALGRAVHVRVAALDLLLATRRASARPRYDSRPILVSPSLLERALEEAASDALTGLPQRAHFMSLLRHELRQRNRRDLVVAYLDLDRFKRVNDEHGHGRGDAVLAALARCARQALRHGDVIARIGGDEFAVLLLDASRGEAEAAVARLRQRFEDENAPLDVSFSAGLALAEADEGPDELLSRADAAMYRDKRARGG